MGALDDAIREHLELKRKHGTSDEEVAHKEKEAMAQGALPGGATLPEEELGADEEPVPTSSPDSAPSLVEELEPDEVLPEEVLDLGTTTVEEPESELDSPPEPDPEGRNGAGFEPTEVSDGALEAEDVLEETPEFLEDVPEQDRLWFDQKPPKDFDFGD